MSYQRKAYLPILILLCIGFAVPSSSRILDGSLVAGYQGWFATACDGSPEGSWIHWCRSDVPSPGQITFEIWPDVRDYDPRDLCATPALGPLANGNPSMLYSAYSARVIDMHVSWASSYGLSGLALQRFVNELSVPSRFQVRTQIAAWIRDACERHNLKFYIEYDVSGASPTEWVNAIMNDWTNVLEGQLNLTASPSYWRGSNGTSTSQLPFVMLWGAGFPDRPGTPDEWLQILSFFRSKNVLVGVGVPYGWRTGSGTSPGFLDVFAKFDVIEPWAVGAIHTDSDIQRDFSDLVPSDLQWCNDRGIEYRRGIFPGFSWSNWNGGSQNMIPRRGGLFMWNQALAMRQVGLTGGFLAMFDEFDEGTAINKAAEDTGMRPTNQWFLSLDADGQLLSSDFYLRLAGAVGKLLRQEIAPSPSVPVPQYSLEQIPPQSPSLYESHVWNSSSADFIVNCGYKTVLNRAADPSGISAFQEVVEKGSLGNFFNDLLTSTEFVNHRSLWTVDDLVERAFQILLNRSPDPSGAEVTANDIRQGQAASRFSDMVASPEFCAKWNVCS